MNYPFKPYSLNTSCESFQLSSTNLTDYFGHTFCHSFILFYSIVDCCSLIYTHTYVRMCALLMLCENNLVPFFFFCCRCGDLNRMSPHRKHHCISSTRKRQNHQTLEERLLSLKLILLYFVFFILYYSFCVGGGDTFFCISFERSR